MNVKKRTKSAWQNLQDLPAGVEIGSFGRQRRNLADSIYIPGFRSELSKFGLETPNYDNEADVGFLRRAKHFTSTSATGPW